MVNVRFMSAGVANRYRPALMAVVAVCGLSIVAGCASAQPAIPSVHRVWLVIDPVVCKQSNCVCATPDPFHVTRGDSVVWINATSAEVIITPSLSGAFTGKNTHTVGNVAGVVTVVQKDIIPVTVSTSLKANTPVTLNLAVGEGAKICDEYHGPRMEIDN